MGANRWEEPAGDNFGEVTKWQRPRKERIWVLTFPIDEIILDESKERPDETEDRKKKYAMNQKMEG